MPAAAGNSPLCRSRLIVCEKSGDWAKSLRRTLPDGGRWIAETRSFNQLIEATDDHPVSLCVIEVTAKNIDRAARIIEQLHHNRPHCNLVAVGQEELARCEMILRELGASYAVTSRRNADELVHLWRQHCRLHPPREETLREHIFADLPWSQ